MDTSRTQHSYVGAMGDKMASGLAYWTTHQGVWV